MFAVIKTGGRQYRVAQDQKITIGRVAGEPGDSVEFGEILMTGDGDDARLGVPFVDGAKVVGEIVEQSRGRKVIAFKKRRRQNSRRKRGHRQELTVIRITGIEASGEGKKSKAKAKDEAPKAEAAAAASAE